MVVKYVHVKGEVYMVQSKDEPPQGISTFIVKGDISMVVDPGPTSAIPNLERCLKALTIEGDLAYVALTHIHLDHAGGSWKLLEDYPRADLYLHPRGAKHMIDPSRLVEAARGVMGGEVDGYGEVKGVNPDRVKESENGAEMDLGSVKIITLWTPGHSSHHQCYHLPGEDVLIVGDMAGRYRPESDELYPTTPPPFNPEKALESLNKLISLDPEVICYSHHGFASNGVEKLERYRKQIKLWDSTVLEGLEEELSVEEIHKRILERDPVAEEFQEFAHGKDGRMPLINLQGFVGYYKWRREKEKT
jgi:glyoxylase-like metal-dependent hydrolase (beta-lactamase superfamily II)